MKAGDLLRITTLRGHDLEHPVWARVKEVYPRTRYNSGGLMTLIAGPQPLHLASARFNLPSNGWAIYSETDAEVFEVFSGADVPDEFYVDQAKWALLSD